MTKKVDAMIADLVQMLEKELGNQLPRDTAQRIKARLSETYGGERLYVEKLPKLVHQVRMASLGSGMASTAMAQHLGVTVQHVRRIRPIR